MNSSRHRRSAGFSLVEVMVSMVIALLTFLVMLQMFESWDRSKRATAAGGGALTSGAVGMYRFERDLRLAGFGLAGALDLGCTVGAFDGSRPNNPGGGAVSATATGLYSFPLTVVQIVDGGTGPDQIAVLYGSSEGIGAVNQAFSTLSAGGQPFVSAVSTEQKEMDIGSLGGFRQGDLAVVAEDPAGTACNLVEITNTAVGDRRSFRHDNAGNYVSAYTGASVTPRFNRLGGFASAATGRVYGFGPAPQRRVWQIREGRTLSFVNDLAWTDIDADGANDFVDVADNVIDLQAQYGIATTPGSAAEAVCNNLLPNPNWTTAAPAAVCQPFLWAIRVAILVRSDEFDKLVVTPTAPAWAGGNFSMTNLDGTAGNTVPADPKDDWRHYRYKVFESVVPLKNNMWGSRA